MPSRWTLAVSAGRAASRDPALQAPRNGIVSTVKPAVTRSRLARDLRGLGLRAGGIAIVHTRMSAIGWVVGGSEAVMHALLDALGPDGTLMAYASWEEHVYHASDWPAEHRDAYLAEPPAFERATAEAVREHGRIPERVRTWPGAERSAHPEASVVAVGPRAGWLTAVHPPGDGYGRLSPFARLVEADGQVLMLGAPLDTITLLHHAEAMAGVPDKRRVTFNVRVVEDGGVVEAQLHRHRHLAPRRLPLRDARARGGRVRRHRQGRPVGRRGGPRPCRAGRVPPVRSPRADRVCRCVARGSIRTRTSRTARRLRPILKSAHRGRRSRGVTDEVPDDDLGSAAELQETRSKEWIEGLYEFMHTLNEGLKEAGELVDAQGLADPDTATTVRFQDAMPVATDGPFAEAKESLVGYWVVDVADEARAVEIASQVVAFVEAPIELRHIIEAPPKL